MKRERNEGKNTVNQQKKLKCACEKCEYSKKGNGSSFHFLQFVVFFCSTRFFILTFEVELLHPFECRKLVSIWFFSSFACSIAHLKHYTALNGIIHTAHLNVKRACMHIKTTQRWPSWLARDIKFPQHNSCFFRWRPNFFLFSVN